MRKIRVASDRFRPPRENYHSGESFYPRFLRSSSSRATSWSRGFIQYYCRKTIYIQLTDNRIRSIDPGTYRRVYVNQSPIFIFPQPTFGPSRTNVLRNLVGVKDFP